MPDFNDPNISEECLRCREKIIAKSKDGTFDADCTGIFPAAYKLEQQSGKTLTEAQAKAASSLLDPIGWAAAVLDWHPRESRDGVPYQATMLRCDAKRKISRIGRRCLTKDSPVLMANGEWRKIIDIKPGDYVASRNKKAQIVKKKVLSFFDNGDRDIYEVRLSNGLKIKCTANHPFLVSVNNENDRPIKKWMSIEDGLSPKTKVTVFNGYEKWGENSSPELAKLLGYMLTDGYFGKDGQTPKFTNNNRRMIDEVSSIVGIMYGYCCSIREKGNGFDIHITDKDHSTVNLFSEDLKKLGLYGIKNSRKYLPDIVNSFNKESAMLLINRMFSGDGGANYWENGKNRTATELALSSTAYGILDQVRLTLLKVGVNGRIEKDSKKDDKHQQLYKLRINDGNSIVNFFNNVGYVYGKEENCKKVLEIVKNKKRKYRTGCKSYRLVTVKSINKVGIEQTYDIEVSDTHNFIANGIVVHNSGKTDSLCVNILYNASTRNGHDILVVCPQKSHAQVIYDRLLELIFDAPDLKNSLKRNVKTPYAEIELHNGSIIKLFTSGSRSGSKGDGVRGQSADALYLDEADYLDPDDLNAIGAILYTNPNVTLWTSSTPTGRRERFYDQCHDSRFREFHYPSTVLPFWNAQMDRDARLDAGTEAGYQHEILAEFGEEVEGVYQNQYVDKALTEYKYEEQKRMDGWIYTMGVDWNDTAIGTQICIVGHDTVNNKYRVVAKHCVDRVGWTQLVAIDKIREVNKYWQCAHIYCDAGFGTTQIELLQQFGERSLSEVGAAHPDSMLRYVKGISAGGTLETRNIRTGITENKPAKPYMIENSVRYFEHNLIEVSKHDDELEQELLGYVVERRTQSGAPVYAQGNKRVGDHELDAMVLALLAFTMEYTEFGQSLVISAVSFGGSFGDMPASKKAPMPGTIELVIENQYRKKQADNKRETQKPQERFVTESDALLNRGLPGIIKRYNSTNTKTIRKGISKTRNSRPSRSNI